MRKRKKRKEKENKSKNSPLHSFSHLHSLHPSLLSLAHTGGNHGSPYVRSAYACSYSCNKYQGGAGSEGLTANAFTYCDSPKGCGENCADFTRGAAPLDGSRDRLFFGPFATAPKSVCTPDNKFPYQMCSCKKVDGEGGGDDSTEWVSGFAVERPAGK